MRSFSDTKSNEWNVSVTIGSVKRVISLLDVNLLDIEQGDPPLMVKLSTDVVLLCDIIYCLVKPQADERDISDEQFGQLLGGDAVLAAQKAFYEEMRDFFQRSGRADRVTALEKQEAAINLAVQKGQEYLQTLNVEKEVSEIYSKLPTNLPESSE